MKKIPLFIAFIMFLLGNASLVFATEVANGPCSNATDLPSCVSGLFQWGIGIAVVLAAISFTIGAVGLIVSGDSAEKTSDAKGRMKSALLGLALIGASFLIMKTINPNIISSTLTKMKDPNTPNISAPPGVYFYSDSECKTPARGPGGSADSLDSGAKYYKIINSSDSNFGIILHKVVGLNSGGPCGQPVLTAMSCTPINDMHGAIDIFEINQTPTTSGDGIGFYSRPYGLDRGSRAGYLILKSGDITKPSTTGPIDENFLWDGVDATDQDKENCGSFKSCPGSIDVKGDYLVAVYSRSSGSGGSNTSSGDYCQTFTDNIDDLNTEPVVAAGTKDIQSIIIIPTGNGGGG